MSSLLYRLGHWAYAHRVRVVASWLLVLLVAGGAATVLSEGTDNTFSIPGTESTRAWGQLHRTFPQVSGTSARLVVVAPDQTSVSDPAFTGPVAQFVATVAQVDLVEGVVDPFVEQEAGQKNTALSDDGRAAIVTVRMTGQGTAVPDAVKDQLVAARDALAAELPDGSQVALGGDLFSINVPALSATEAVGVAVALVVLVITFGSFVAAGMPLLNAVLGVAVTAAGIFATTRFTTIVSTTPLLALMLGLAVGIDYTLFVVSRHTGQLRAGMDPHESAARALATAGSAVVFAGLTVMIALLGLGLAQIPFLTVMGLAGAVGVGMAVLVALTLTPALLGFAGERLRPRQKKRGQKQRGRTAGDGPAHVRPADGEPAARAAATGTDEHSQDGEHQEVHPNRFFTGWVSASTKVPALTVVVVVAALGALALPAQSLRLALPDAGTQPPGGGARVAYDLVAEHFGPGFNGPLLLTGVIVGSHDPLTLMADLRSDIEALPGVAAVPLATPNADATMGVVQVVPQGAPDSVATQDLVHELRAHHDELQAKYGIDLSVTGITAVQIDISAQLGGALLPFGLFVVGLSILLLMMVFRSLWVPLTAAVGYALSVGAAFGTVALVFEHGVGAGLLNLDPVPQAVLSFMPIVTMGVLFGLAMDYEVFLVARMREEYVHHGDARRAVRVGFLSSAKVVTAAALIMFSVFIAFVPGHETMIKPIALGLATGVAVDAFVVRMTLIPAVLHLLGDRAWHMPRWLDRRLPHFDVEGSGLAEELRLAGWPESGADDVIAAHGLRLDAPDGSPIFADVSARVKPGGRLLVTGPHRSGRTALLLALAGRAHLDAGTLKVAGLVASVRARDIRHRVAFARLARTADPVAELDEAFATGAPVVVVDDLDAVGDPLLRAAVRHRLAAAQAADPRMVLVVSALEVAAVTDLLAPAATLTLPPRPALQTTLQEASR
ncbi:MAG: MMPL family transporter [Micrococcales bacterium]|nr:MMPL family transporter [Micrococcales bacterium]